MFFYNATEIQEYVDVNASFDFELLKPKLKQVDREVLKLYFGYDFIADLQTKYDATTNGNISTLTAIDKKAIELMRTISAPIAMAHWVTGGQLQIDSAGIFIATNENRKTAFEWQINTLIKSYLHNGYQAIEEAIFLLSNEISNYSLFANYSEYKYYKRSFIEDSKEFTRLYSPLNNCYYNYVLLRSCMDKVDELEIKNTLLSTLYNGIKNRLETNALTPADNLLLPSIKKALANLTMFKAVSELGVSFDAKGFLEFDNTSGMKTGDAFTTAKGENINRLHYSLKQSGETYLKELKQILETNKANYPEYTSDANYTTGQTAIVENKEGQGYYVA